MFVGSRVIVESKMGVVSSVVTACFREFVSCKLAVRSTVAVCARMIVDP